MLVGKNKCPNAFVMLLMSAKFELLLRNRVARVLDKIRAKFQFLRNRVAQVLDKIRAKFQFLRNRVAQVLDKIRAKFQLLRDRIARALDKTMATMLVTDKFQHPVMQIQLV